MHGNNGGTNGDAGNGNGAAMFAAPANPASQAVSGDYADDDMHGAPGMVMAAIISTIIVWHRFLDIK